MSTNLKNRSIALGATFALLASGFVATAPAAYAASTVGLAPTSGTNLGAFTTDDFSMDVTVPLPNDPVNLVIRVDNPEKEFMALTVRTGVNTVSDIALRGFNALGVQQDLSAMTDAGQDNASGTATVRRISDVKGVQFTGVSGALLIDFATLGITSLVVSELEPEGGNTDITIRTVTVDLQLLETANLADPFEYGDGNRNPVTVTAYSENRVTPKYGTIDTSAASQPATVSFYDPAGVAVIPTIERFIEADNTTFVANDSNDQNLGVKARFIRPDLNLDQVDLDKWTITVNNDQNAPQIASLSTSRSGVGLAGSKDSNDKAGAVYALANLGTNLSTSLHTVRIKHMDNAKVFTSGGYTVPSNDQTRDLFVTITDGDNSDHDPTAPIADPQAAGANDNDATLRPGTESFTYNARLFESVGSDRAKVASQLIVATVQAGTYMPAGTELTVSGSSTKLSAASQATVVSGLTDSNGDFAVTVTSSNPIAKTNYTVDFYSVDASDLLKKTTAAGSLASTASRVVSTYETAGVTGSSALTLDSDVVAGSSVTINASVADTYGQPTNLVGTKALYVTVQGTDTDDLDETVAVAADGTASISFTNYVASGESDVLNVYLHSGATYSTSNSISSASKVVSLYNPGAVSAVNAPATMTGNITYDDFILGKASSTNVGPNDNGMDITGTVVDANGAGVPGAVVTVDADGLQLRQKGTGNYFQDSITFTGDAAGRFTVTLWSHTVNPTGVDVTITSGDKSATTTVKTYLPTGLSGGNLVFELDMPKNIKVNTTYAITASLTDKWGNPVRTTGATKAVEIQGFGSVNINSKDSASTDKDFGSDGKTVVFLRSIKDIEGPGSVQATLNNADYFTSATATATLSRTEVLTDVAGTVHDETSFSNEIAVDVNVGDAAASTSTDTKVNAGSFKGYVAVYAKGHEGKRLSAKIGNDWVIVPSLASNFERVVDFTGAGVNIAVRIYIDRVLTATIPLVTK